MNSTTDFVCTFSFSKEFYIIIGSLLCLLSYEWATCEQFSLDGLFLYKEKSQMTEMGLNRENHKTKNDLTCISSRVSAEISTTSQTVLRYISMMISTTDSCVNFLFFLSNLGETSETKFILAWNITRISIKSFELWTSNLWAIEFGRALLQIKKNHKRPQI